MNTELKRGDRYSIEGCYYNANGFAVAIVAFITHEVDWAGYIGATLGHRLGRSIRENETVQYVAENGCKLPEKDARHFFPEIELPYRY